MTDELPAYRRQPAALEVVVDLYLPGQIVRGTAQRGEASPAAGTGDFGPSTAFRAWSSCLHPVVLGRRSSARWAEPAPRC